jgi:CheY-like chemotaxis protein
VNDTVGIFNLLIKRQDIGSNKNLLLKVVLPDELRKIQVITDKLRLEQILSNLISNAIKFTPQGYVEVGCSKLIDREMLEFYVKDTGTGIKEENQQVIFERFRKVEEDKSHLHRGTGLGLAISSQLISLLGGTISLSSKPGEGSVFYFTIPLIKSDSPYNPILKARISDRIPDFKNRCVMVAEDDMSNFKYIERILKKAGLKVVHAENGSQVLSMLQKPNDIKLILLDIKMPGMDGIETLHEIRKMNVTLPVIAQTAYALADEVWKFRKEGFDDYIAKPISVDNLYFMIEKFLNPSDRLDG